MREHAGASGDPGALYQALITLGNWGEHLPYDSWWAGDEQENRRRARRYLAGLDAPPIDPRDARLMNAVAACDLGEVRAALAAGADANAVIPVFDDSPDPPKQPDTPLELVVFRVSDAMLDDDDLRRLAEIARLLVEHGADPAPAMAMAEHRYGPYDPDLEGRSPRSGTSSPGRPGADPPPAFQATLRPP